MRQEEGKHKTVIHYIEKYPTSTSIEVGAGWGNPTRVYAKDGNCATCSVDGDEQGYGGFGFNFASTDQILKVLVSGLFLIVDWVGAPILPMACTSVAVGTSASYIETFDGQFIQLEANGDAVHQAGTSSANSLFEATAVLDTPAKLNDARLKLVATIEGAGTLYCDYLSILVIYDDGIIGAGSLPSAPIISYKGKKALKTLHQILQIKGET